MWSDDFYHPETPEFRAAFSEDERKVLQDFDDAFNEVCQHLHGASVPTEQFIGSALGCELASGAKKALACLQKQDRKDISIPKERH
jgi:hypothetical protein